MPNRNEQPIILQPGEGRSYDCGSMQAVFKADGDECGDRYSVSEWTLAPRSAGPGPHAHKANEELFLVTDGTLRILVGEDWIEAARGAFVRIPAGVVHDFENRSDAPATLFNVYLPGGFEPAMPSIVEWFAKPENQREGH